MGKKKSSKKSGSNKSPKSKVNGTNTHDGSILPEDNHTNDSDCEPTEVSISNQGGCEEPIEEIDPPLEKFSEESKLPCLTDAEKLVIETAQLLIDDTPISSDSNNTDAEIGMGAEKSESITNIGDETAASESNVEAKDDPSSPAEPSIFNKNGNNYTAISSDSNDTDAEVAMNTEKSEPMTNIGDETGASESDVEMKDDPSSPTEYNTAISSDSNNTGTKVEICAETSEPMTNIGDETGASESDVEMKDDPSSPTEYDAAISSDSNNTGTKVEICAETSEPMTVIGDETGASESNVEMKEIVKGDPSSPTEYDATISSDSNNTGTKVEICAETSEPMTVIGDETGASESNVEMKDDPSSPTEYDAAISSDSNNTGTEVAMGAEKSEPIANITVVKGDPSSPTEASILNKEGNNDTAILLDANNTGTEVEVSSEPSVVKSPSDEKHLGQNIPVVPVSTSTSQDVAFKTVYTFDQLLSPIDGVDWSKREDYLSDEDFLNRMTVTREAFASLAPWKRKALKQKAGLF